MRLAARHEGAATLRRLDLAPLYEQCLLHSDVRKETYDCIAGELCDYGLTWRGADVDARAYKARMGAISFYAMQYGDEVAITPDLYRDFMLVHVSLRNGIEIEADGRLSHVPEGGVFFSAPQQRIRLRWQEGCQQLLVRVPLALVGGEAGPRRTLVRSGHMLAPALAPLFVDQINLALGIARHGIELDNLDDWRTHVETGFARFAGMQLFDLGAAAARADRPRQDGRDRRERLESFIHARLAAPITLEDLTAAVGVGRSQLNSLCREAFDCSPMALVRRMRLEAARGDLEREPDQDLTSLSLRYGFEHQSRFAQYYRDAFGERPRDTRRRLRG